MSDGFDAYHVWLGIPPREQPPNHYRLLGLKPLESDPDVIESAAERAARHLRSLQGGEHPELCRKLLSEISAARLVLLDAAKKKAYDQALKQKAAAQRSGKSPSASSRSGRLVRARPIETASGSKSGASKGGGRESGVPVRSKQGDESEGPASQPVWLWASAGGGILVVAIFAAGLLLGGGGDETPVAEEEPTAPREESAEPSAEPPSPRDKGAGTSERGESETTTLKSRPSDDGGDASEAKHPPDDPGRTTPGAGDPAERPGEAPVNTIGGTRPDPPDAPQEKSGLEPIPAGDTVLDLLPAVEVEQDALNGNWLRSGSDVVSEPIPSCRLMLPVELHGSYELAVRATRQAGRDCIGLVLPVGETNIALIVSGWGGNISGLSFIRGQLGNVNETRRPGQIESYVAHDIYARVELKGDQAQIRVKLDGQPYIEWSGPQDDLKAGGGWTSPNAAAPCIGSWMITAAFHRVAVRMLDGTAKPLRPFDEQVVKPEETLIPEPEPVKRLAVPDDETRKQLRNQLREVYEVEFAAAREPDQKRELAELLIEQAKGQEDDADGKFIMLDAARELATEAGDIGLALEAVGRVAAEFEVDGPAMKLAALEAFRFSSRQKEENRELAEAALGLIEEARRRNDFESAEELADLALSAARRVRDLELVKYIADVNDHLEKLADSFEAYQRAQKVLEGDPENADACVVAGRYLCRSRGEWEEGLKMLARGSDETLARLAEQDLADPADPLGQLKLAESWYEHSQNAPHDDRPLAAMRARHWYQEATARVPALKDARIERRLEDIAGLLEREVPLAPPRKVRYALEFAGNEHVLLPSLRYDGTKPLTIEAYVLLDAHRGEQCILGNADGDGISFGLHPSGRWQCFGFFDAGRPTIASDEPAALNRVVHVAVVYDGRDMGMFVDGQPQRQTARVGRHRPERDRPFTIGVEPATGNGMERWFHGRLLGLRVSLAARYREAFEPPAKLVADGDTVCLYALEEGEGDVLRDSSGNDHHGQIRGAEWVEVEEEEDFGE